MAIHPRYAEAILDGRKQVEFRKRRLADDIDTVLIYATAPVGKVIGEFRISETVVDSPDSIWDCFGPVGVIEQDDFFSYYANRAEAVAIVVHESVRYPQPRDLTDLEQSPSVPQSFSYLHATA